MSSEKPRRSSRKRKSLTPQQIARTRRNHVLMLSLLVLIAFASALPGDFVWTDRGDLLDGEHRLQSLEDIPAALSLPRAAYRERHQGGTIAAGGSWQPMTVLSNSISWSVWGDCSTCLHAENILLHLAVVIGFYALARHLLVQRRRGNSVAAWSAAIFAVHPATVTSVAWIGGRPHLLAAALGIWSLVLFTRLQATTKSRAGHRNRWMLGMAACAMGAMLAHESAYILPLLALLVAGVESKERGRSSLFGISPNRLLALGLMLSVLLTLLLIRKLALGGLYFGGDYPTASIISNLGTALNHFWFMVTEVLLPTEPVLSDARAITHMWGAKETAGLIGVFLLTGLMLVGLKLGHPAAFGVAWFMLCLIPGSGLFPSEHYHSSNSLYLAAWGSSFSVVYLLFRLWRPIGRQLIPGTEALIYVPLLAVLVIITGLSNTRWWDHERLFESEVAYDPHYMEGRVELSRAALDKGQYRVAQNHAMAAIRASNDKTFTGFWPESDAYRLLGQAQWHLGEQSEAMESLDTALQLRPNDAELVYWRGLVDISAERWEAAEKAFRRALQLAPGMSEARADLGVALVGQSRFVEAHPLLEQAVTAPAGNHRRHVALAKVMVDAGQFQKAATHLAHALEIQETADDRARLAWVKLRQGDRAAAGENLNMAMQMDEVNSPYVSWVQKLLLAPPPATSDATEE